MITVRRIALGLLALFVLWIGLLLWPDHRPPGPPFTIAKDTTYLTEPLRADGYVDYVAALNQRNSQGVTSENNAVVLLWKATGPSEIPPQQREAYFKLLGIPPLAEKGDYFVKFETFAAEKEAEAQRAAEQKAVQAEGPGEDEQDRNGQAEEKKPLSLWKQLGRARLRPWSKDEYPLLAEWLAANQRALAIVLEASTRPRYYSPLVGETHDWRGSLALAGIDATRNAAEAIVVRAMLRLHEGRTREAWQDLLAVHRLARLVGQDPRVMGFLAGTALEGHSCVGDQALLQHPQLSITEIRKMRSELAALPSPLPLADRLDSAERCLSLDVVAWISRKGFQALGTFNAVSTRLGTLPPFLNRLAIRQIHWDRVLRMVNAGLDRAAAACRRPNYQERKEALNRISEELDILGKDALDTKGVALDLLFLRRKALSDRVGHAILAMILPGLAMVAEIEDRSNMQFNLTVLGLALAEYRAEHGSYPSRLAELAPKYVPKVPRDLFNDEDLHYQLKDDGYALWSVGPNGVDDGGKNRTDHEYSDAYESWDELSVRVPAPQGPGER